MFAPAVFGAGHRLLSARSWPRAIRTTVAKQLRAITRNIWIRSARFLLVLLTRLLLFFEYVPTGVSVRLWRYLPTSLSPSPFCLICDTFPSRLSR